MVSTGQFLAFAVASLILIVIPGPSVLFVVGRALGVGTLVERSALVFTIVKLAGGLYLVWLGVRAVRQRRGLATAFEKAQAPRGGRRAALEGFLVGVANPKAVILFAAVLPGFVNRHAGHVPAQMLLLSLVSFTIALISDSAWSIVASTARSWFGRSPRRLELVGGAGGLAMIGLGISVAATGRKT
jgi:threonine/homoserine/homoserine lactone efflux protein